PMILGFTVIAVWLSDSWKMGLYFVGGLGASILCLGGLAAVLFLALRQVVSTWGARLPASFRHGFANIYRPGNQARSVLVALGVGVMFTLSTYLLQRTVLQEVVSEGPGREGNLFLLDIRNASEVSRVVESQPGVTSKLQLAGYIIAKMLTKNGVPADRLRISTQRRNQLGAVRITTAAQLPDSLELKQGHWWNPSSDTPQLAVSEEASRDFHLHPGDRVGFEIAGHTTIAPVVATFRREARAPVRYDLVFPERALAGLPVVYYGAVHADPSKIAGIEEVLFDKFPTITVMNLADVLKRIQDAVDQVAAVVRFLALFAIVAGLIILSASVAGTRYRRLREVAILKMLGGTKRRIASIFSLEFSLLGVMAGAVGGLLANFFTRIVAEKFIETSVAFDWISVLVAMFATALLANAAGWLASARILDRKPLEVLRGE
ncbi:MAG: FtsX-like permease family protein, partial [Acidobacteriaceae bacterium]|nr:FtsX-like permease family protein [Acidobacteriaceae bacterium]